MGVVYEDGGVTVYQGNCLAHPEWWAGLEGPAVLITDPPYGMGYVSGKREAGQQRAIIGDEDTQVRDQALRLWGDRPGLCFGKEGVPAPSGETQRLIWHKAGTPGMGDLSSPWGPNYEVIHVLGRWRRGKGCRRRGSVITTHGARGRASGEENRWGHPTPKPVGLMEQLVECVPPGVVVVDPFAGSGATLRAAKNLGRRVVGVEVEERYCRVIVDRLQQETLWV